MDREGMRRLERVLRAIVAEQLAMERERTTATWFVNAPAANDECCCCGGVTNTVQTLPPSRL